MENLWHHSITSQKLFPAEKYIKSPAPNRSSLIRDDELLQDLVWWYSCDHVIGRFKGFKLLPEPNQGVKKSKRRKMPFLTLFLTSSALALSNHSQNKDRGKTNYLCKSAGEILYSFFLFLMGLILLQGV